MPATEEPTGSDSGSTYRWLGKMRKRTAGLSTSSSGFEEGICIILLSVQLLGSRHIDHSGDDN